MYSLPDLPYEYNALEPYIDTTTMQIHHGKHHAAYVKNLNDLLSGHEDLLSMNIDDLVRDLSKVPENVRAKVRNNGGGHANHSLFWTVMATKGEKTPSGDLLAAIGDSFGDIKSLKKKMSEVGVGRFGSGWAWLYMDGGKLAIIDTPNQDTPLMEGKVPVLGLDVWEHAYYLKYQNRRVEYIEAWWNVVNWDEVARRFNESRKTT